MKLIERSGLILAASLAKTDEFLIKEVERDQTDYGNFRVVHDSPSGLDCLTRGTMHYTDKTDTDLIEVKE